MIDWHPTAPLNHLRLRADVLARTRRFFVEAGVLEVETPILSPASGTDPHLSPFVTRFEPEGGGAATTLYLHTSPELYMKRLLAAGSGPIVQIGKVFRNGEAGSRHNPEFTMVEWYRPGWNLLALINEVGALLQTLLNCPPITTLTFQQAFVAHAGVDPLAADLATLAEATHRLHLDPPEGLDRDGLIDFLLCFAVEPHLGHEHPVALTAWPVSHAALAQVSPNDPRTAERFEVFYQGIELANGFNELCDAAEQRRRFEEDNRLRKQMEKPALPLDERFLGALEAGMPQGCGVALGFDRVVMLAAGASRIEEVMGFGWRGV
ncbi:MAG: hypothetical protein COX57_10085 [Alphaproteobacteria bacterium CG_4_10_14_0_2_um_filter_63_37]|nr:MAG: EF-P lysine aminoacylase GenX [Proteobacteria bacterium CG1_02_64_396]PJA24129.1 MAG: hypothetical protein COX57_10085 [Alphaproteobacteria bacterium CG_4_10_14_0_2_um_filter_63_37]